jgi:hypothetical protein
MKRLILVVALSGALAACGDAAEEAAAPEAEAPAAEVVPAAAPTSSAGTYEVTMADGTAYTATMNTDGTYQDTDAEGTVFATGTWEDRPDGSTCFDSEGGDDAVVCYTVGAAAEDGTMTATPDNGSEPLTIKKTA